MLLLDVITHNHSFMKRILSAFFALFLYAGLTVALPTFANTYPQLAVPHIDSISPATVSPGTLVTLTGSGFMRDNAQQTGVTLSLGSYGPIVYVSGTATANGKVASDTSITFTLPASVNSACSSHTAPCTHKIIQDGSYPLTVKNAYGTSNSVSLKVSTAAGVKLTMPAGGESWKVGSQQVVRWKYSKVDNIKSVTLSFVNSAGTIVASAPVAPYSTYTSSYQTALNYHAETTTSGPTVGKSILVPLLADGNYTLAIHVASKKGTAATTTYDSATSAFSVSNPVKGAFESASCSVQDSLVGWACDPTSSDKTLKVFFTDGKSTVSLATTIASGARTDIASYCGGNSSHGFSVALPKRLFDGKSRKLSAFAYDASGIKRPFGFQTIACAAATSSPSVVPAVSIVSAATSTPWVFGTHPQVAFHATVATGTVSAVLSKLGRSYEVGNASAASGTIALDIASVPSGTSTLKLSLHIGSRSYSSASIPVFIAASTTQSKLPASNSAKVDGSVDDISCSVIEGWACDGSSSSIQVRAYDEKGRLLATHLASGARPDVSNAGRCGSVGAPFSSYGFSFKYPSADIDGQPHTISIYGVENGSSGKRIHILSPLTTVPQSLTCSLNPQ